MENLVDNSFDILKNIDNEELYNKTFITLENLEAIKKKNFQAFTRFKLMGFIDILSKRLNLDLSEFRAEAIVYFDSLEPVVEVVEEPVKETKSLDKKVVIAIGASLVVILLAFFINFIIDLNTKNDLTEVEVSPPSKVEELPPVNLIIKDSNTTSLETNKTEENITVPTTTTPAVIASKNDGEIKIVPTRKIWIGIIDLDTKKKKDYTTQDELVIDKTKNQIIVINGAYLSLMVGDNETKYNYEGRVRFICKDGKIEETSYTNFKALNGGKAWN